MPDPSLRRLDLSVTYQPAFLFWNLKGVLAERWAHGPYFGAVQDQGNQITLLPDPEQKGTAGEPNAVGGIAISAFTWESPPSLGTSSGVAVEWLTDVLTALDPKTVVRIWGRQHWVLPLRNPAAVQSAIVANLPALSEHVPNGYGAPYSGLSFNADRHIANVTRLLSVHVGIIRPGTSKTYWSSPSPDDDQPMLGIFVEVTDTAPDTIPDPKRALRELSTALENDARHVLTRMIPRIAPNG